MKSFKKIKTVMAMLAISQVSSANSGLAFETKTQEICRVSSEMSMELQAEKNMRKLISSGEAVWECPLLISLEFIQN